MNVKKMINDYLAKEIFKIIIKFICAIGLTYLAVKNNFYTAGNGTIGKVEGVLLTFCIIFFLCSVMHVCLQKCRSIIAAIIAGLILIAILMAGLSFLPDEAEGYVFMAAILIAILYDVIRLIKHIRYLASSYKYKLGN